MTGVTNLRRGSGRAGRPIIGSMRAIGWLIIAGALMPSARAETTVQCGDGDCKVIVEGRIGAADLRAFREAAKLPRARKGPVLVYLNSTGGEVEAALEIGRVLRTLPTTYTMVHESSVCHGACVFVLAAGHGRIADGRIGVHRLSPASGTGGNPGDAKEGLAELRGKIRAYLEFVNVRSVLLDAMQRVPANEMKILREVEVRQFGLNEFDPAYQDRLDTRAATRHGLRKTDYLLRKLEAQQRCRDAKPDLSRPESIVAQLAKLNACIDEGIRRDR